MKRHGKKPGVCARPGCTRRRTPDGEPRPDRYCKACRAIVSAISYRKNRKQHNSRRRERADLRSADQRAADSARSKLSMAIVRGTMSKGRCVRCGTSSDITAYIADPKNWRTVVWVCRDDRAAEIALRQSAETKAVAWQTLSERFAAEWPMLAPDIQAKLQAEAACNSVFAGVLASPGSPLYRQQLMAAFRRYSDRQLAD